MLETEKVAKSLTWYAPYFSPLRISERIFEISKNAAQFIPQLVQAELSYSKSTHTLLVIYILFVMIDRFEQKQKRLALI